MGERKFGTSSQVDGLFNVAGDRVECATKNARGTARVSVEGGGVNGEDSIKSSEGRGAEFECR